MSAQCRSSRTTTSGRAPLAPAYTSLPRRRCGSAPRTRRPGCRPSPRSTPVESASTAFRRAAVVPCQRTYNLDPRPETRRAVALPARPPHGGRAPRLGVGHRLRGERGLAHAGLTGSSTTPPAPPTAASTAEHSAPMASRRPTTMLAATPKFWRGRPCRAPAPPSPHVWTKSNSPRPSSPHAARPSTHPNGQTCRPSPGWLNTRLHPPPQAARLGRDEHAAHGVAGGRRDGDAGEASPGEHLDRLLLTNAVPSPASPSASETVRQCRVLTANPPSSRWIASDGIWRQANDGSSGKAEHHDGA